MANQWFRLYSEFSHDPKVQMLSEADQRRLIMLMCIRSGNNDETFRDTATAFQLRISIDDWTTTKAVFVASGFIDETNKLLNWDKRQYVSDSSTERVRKHRDTKRKTMKLNGNVSVTPPDTDTDTDTDTDKKDLLSDLPKQCRFEEFWSAFDDPGKRGKKPSLKNWNRINPDNALADKIIAGAKLYRKMCVSEKRKKRFCKQAQGWLTDDGWTADMTVEDGRISEGSGFMAEQRAEDF